MYDTAAVIFDQPPGPVVDSPGWQHERVVTDLTTGERRVARTLNVKDGPSLTLLPDGRLKVERSLPKALTGQNVEDMAQSDVTDAIEVVDQEVARALGTLALPSVGEMMPVRVDYCESRRLGSEDAVRADLLRLATVELPRKGKPVRGESGSVAWPIGAIRPKVYGKYVETRGSDSAFGVLRVEVGAFRLRTFRSLLGRSTGHRVTLEEVLTDVVRTAVMGRYAPQLGGGIAMVHELRDSRLAAEMFGLFGWRRTATLMGAALLWHVAGEPEVRTMDPAQSPFGSRATHYRIVSDYRRLRLALEEKGYRVVASGDQDTESVVRLAIQVA
jgi:hypothetical protein